MFKHVPRILSHISAISSENFVTPEYILSKSNNGVQLLNRYCPHRMYPLSSAGENVSDITCKFHGFHWDKQGNPTNNDRKIKCGSAEVGKSGLIFKDFIEPNALWVSDLEKETNLVYSHSMKGTSKGSWLWMMDIQADLFHIRTGEDVVHPELSKVTNLEEVGMFEGDGWVLQTCSTGWWLCIYPYTFIEWSPGCLAINYTTPDDYTTEFGFEWITQFYYDPATPKEKRADFETLEDVFREDVVAIEMQKGKWFPIKKPHNRLENHCVHFGEWVQSRREKQL